MEHCPLCGNRASIEPPEWSGGRILIICPDCGEFSTNQIVIDELDRLRAEGSSRIGELQYSIEIADHPWYLNWSPSLKMIALEHDAPREMTKHQKKMRRRSRSTSASAGPNLFYDPDHDSKGE